jgi:hypothetical protein
LFFDRRQFFAFAQQLDSRFDLALVGEAADLVFGEDLLAVDEDVELAGLADLGFSVFAEFGPDRGGQTDRARLVASSRAVKDFNSHR